MKSEQMNNRKQTFQYTQIFIHQKLLDYWLGHTKLVGYQYLFPTEKHGQKL